MMTSRGGWVYLCVAKVCPTSAPTLFFLFFFRHINGASYPRGRLAPLGSFSCCWHFCWVGSYCTLCVLDTRADGISRDGSKLWWERGHDT